MGRVQRQRTLSAIPKQWLPITWLVVPPAERNAHKHPQILVVAEKGIGPARDGAVAHAKKENKVLMLDDDLKFFVRGPKRNPDSKCHFSLWPASSEDMTNMLDTVEKGLDMYGCVSVAAREGCNRLPHPRAINQRHLRMLGYRIDALRKTGVQFKDMPLMEDFHVQLSLLENGHRSCVFTQWAHDQSSTNISGGCSTYRTLEAQSAAAHRLAELHPDTVKVVEKVTKTDRWKGMGTTRTDVVIQWKKAYEPLL